MESDMNPAHPFQAFEGQRYLSLETFRKSGQGVRTPVWFAVGPADPSGTGAPVLYVYTIGNSGKAKRIRNNPLARIAPCDMRGNVKGEWVDVTVTILPGEEASHGMNLINRKYVPWKQLLDFFAMLRWHDRIVFAIRPR
jgi:PPOX class probable F420-dependent enzyme